LIKAGFFDPEGSPREMMHKLMELRQKNEEVPVEYDHDNSFKWALEKRDAFGVLVKPWKESAPFHKNVRTYQGNEMSKLDDGTKVFLGGLVTGLVTRVTKRGDWYARLIVEDTDERHVIMMWGDFWGNSELDIPYNTDRQIDPINGRRKRPKKGDLVEIIGHKESWNDRVQVIVNSSDAYVRVVATEKEVTL